MKWYEQLKTKLQKIPWLWIVALFCLALSVLLLWHQVTLNREASAALSSLQVTQLPSIRWFEEETTEAPPTSANILSSEDTPTQGTVMQQAVSGKIYVLNTNSKKIHSPSCRYAQSMKDENKQTVTEISLEELQAQGYEICSVCGAK